MSEIVQDINFILSHLDQEDQGRRLLLAMPQSAGDVLIATSLLRSINEQYPDYNIYFACNPEFFSILNGNPYVYRVIPYNKIMITSTLMEGHSHWEGLFEIAFNPYILSQYFIEYVHNGKTNLAYNIRYEDALS